MPDRVILVVDDEPDLAATYERLLRRRGHRVVSAGTCRQALEILGAEPVHLVVADLRLPDGDGLAVVRAARATLAPTPVIVVTGYPSEGTRTQALEAGASAYLGKPFGLATLTDLVDTFVGTAPEKRPPRDEPRATPGDPR